MPLEYSVQHVLMADESVQSRNRLFDWNVAVALVYPAFQTCTPHGTLRCRNCTCMHYTASIFMHSPCLLALLLPKTLLHHCKEQLNQGRPTIHSGSLGTYYSTYTLMCVQRHATMPISKLVYLQVGAGVLTLYLPQSTAESHNWSLVWYFSRPTEGMLVRFGNPKLGCCCQQ